MKASKLSTILQARLADWAVTMKGSREYMVDYRIQTGGYHKPGRKPGSPCGTLPNHESAGKGEPSKTMQRLRELARTKWGREYQFGR